MNKSITCSCFEQALSCALSTFYSSNDDHDNVCAAYAYIDHGICVDRDGTKSLTVQIPAAPGIAIRRKDGSKDSGFRLVAAKDFDPGDVVYTFCSLVWPEDEDTVGRIPNIDLLAPPPPPPGLDHNNSDDWPEEGTVVFRANHLQHGIEDHQRRLRFTGYNMMTVHSCVPNIVYKYTDACPKDDKDDEGCGSWENAYAARPIQKGEVLSIDFNTVWWNRPDSSLDDDNDCVCLWRECCTCGTDCCRGTWRGFRDLTQEDRDEQILSWLGMRPSRCSNDNVVKRSDKPSPSIARRLLGERVQILKKRCGLAATEEVDPATTELAESSYEPSYHVSSNGDCQPEDQSCVRLAIASWYRTVSEGWKGPDLYQGTSYFFS